MFITNFCIWYLVFSLKHFHFVFLATAEAKKQLMDDPNTNIDERWSLFVELFNRKYKDQAETDMRLIFT